MHKEKEMESKKLEGNSIFEAALGLQEPWFIEKTEFKGEGPKGGALHIFVSYRKGAKLPSPDGRKELCQAVRAVKKDWLNPGFFQFPCIIHARIPRIKCSDGSTETASVPWEVLPGFEAIKKPNRRSKHLPTPEAFSTSEAIRLHIASPLRGKQKLFPMKKQNLFIRQEEEARNSELSPRPDRIN